MFQREQCLMKQDIVDAKGLIKRPTFPVETDQGDVCTVVALVIFVSQ